MGGGGEHFLWEVEFYSVSNTDTYDYIAIETEDTINTDSHPLSILDF